MISGLYQKINRAKQQLYVFEEMQLNRGRGHRRINVHYSAYLDFREFYSRHTYYLKRCLYHAEQFTAELRPELPPFVEEEGVYHTLWWRGEGIHFEFEAFISAAAAFFEESLRLDAKKVFKGPMFERFTSFFPTRQHEDSIVWRLSVIRNRVVHPDYPAYDKKGSRIGEFKAKYAGSPVTIKDGDVKKLLSNLIDVEYCPTSKALIQDIIKDTKTVKRDFKRHQVLAFSPSRRS